MDWLSQNWVWFLFIGVMVAMHLFGHGGHGAHGKTSGGHRGCGSEHPRPPEDETTKGHKPDANHAGH